MSFFQYSSESLSCFMKFRINDKNKKQKTWHPLSICIYHVAPEFRNKRFRWSHSLSIPLSSETLYLFWSIIPSSYYPYWTRVCSCKVGNQSINCFLVVTISYFHVMCLYWKWSISCFWLVWINCSETLSSVLGAWQSLQGYVCTHYDGNFNVYLVIKIIRWDWIDLHSCVVMGLFLV